MSMTSEELQGALQSFVAQQLGVDSVEVRGLQRLPGGASKETWAFDLSYESEGAVVRLPLVLRRDPGGSQLATERGAEFRLQCAVHAAGVPVPRPYWQASDPAVAGAPYYVMDRVAGETLARRLLRDPEYAEARRCMTRQLGEILARIHGIDVERHELGFLPQTATDGRSALAEVDRYEKLYREIALEPHPAFELAFRWLRQHLPRSEPARLVHGDFRVGNVIFGPEGVRSILDWELAHLGDPIEDLGWLCVRAWRFGRDDKPVGGIGDREELFDAYQRGGGRAVDPQHVRFWEVFGNLKWATICIVQSRTHLDGHVRSVELASLGRRTAETELELLDLVEHP